MRILCALLAGVLMTTTAVAEEIKVSVAVSLKEAVTEIAKDYKAGGGDDVTFTFGASGQLATQIKNGAEVDAFISAANKQVDDLVSADLAVASTRRTVVGNTLVLVVPEGTKDFPTGFMSLADVKFKKIAIGDPATVPAGDYAMQTLAALKLAETLKERFVYGTNVRQVLTYVEGGEVAAGLVYATDAKESGDKVKVVATADEKLHSPIVYPAIVCKGSKKQDAALKFLDFMKGEKAKQVFVSKGFAVEPAAASAR